MSAEAARTESRRAVLYLRQSISREESISLELQERAGREYCDRMGYIVARVEEDPGISGRTWKRPGVLRVMDMIERREADVVILWKWSRLSRSRLDWAVAIDKVESLGGRIESATETVDVSTSTGRLARGMLAEFAAFESERIGDGWKETMQRRVRHGVPGTGGDRFGYIRTSKDSYEIDPLSGPILAEAYRRYVEDEHGWSMLARWLNTTGAQTLKGTLWDGTKIRGILDAGFAAGLLATGYRTPKLSYHPGTQPAIIDEEMWARYLHRRAQAPRPARLVEPRSPLSGLLWCDDCGGKMKSHMRANNRKRIPGYVCTNALAYRDGRRFVTCARHAAESAVRAWVGDLASDVEAVARIKQQIDRRRVTSISDGAAIAKLADKATSSLGALTVKFVEGKISEAAYQSAAARLEADIARLQERKRDSEPSPGPELDIRKLAVQVDKLWDDMTPMELRTFLLRMIAEVRVVPPEVRRNGGGGRVTFKIRGAWEASPYE